MKKSTVITASVALLATAGMAHAIGDSITIDISGMNSWDEFGAADNEFMFIDIGGGLPVTITGLFFDGSVTTVGPSWVSEVTFILQDEDQTTGVGLGSGGPGSPNNNLETPVSGGGKFVDLNFNPPFVSFDAPTGVVRFELAESFDDEDGVIDATLGANSTITIQYQIIPAPGALALLGLAGVCGTSRRRRN